MVHFFIFLIFFQKNLIFYKITIYEKKKKNLNLLNNPEWHMINSIIYQDFSYLHIHRQGIMINNLINFLEIFVYNTKL